MGPEWEESNQVGGWAYSGTLLEEDVWSDTTDSIWEVKINIIYSNICTFEIVVQCHTGYTMLPCEKSNTK